MADFDAVLAVNTIGFFHITQLAIAEMEKRSERARGPDHHDAGRKSEFPGLGAFSRYLTKGGLNAATKALAIEYAKRGIRVNAVSPGIIKTPMHPTETHAALDAMHPIGHMGDINDIVQGRALSRIRTLRDGRDSARGRWSKRRQLSPTTTQGEKR